MSNYECGGLELRFFESAQFEPMNALPEGMKALVRNGLRLLMMGWQENWRQMFYWRLFKAVFITRDSELLQAMRGAFQEGFDNIYQQLSQNILTPQQHNQALLYLSNCLNVLPFADITPHESIAIPQWLDERWQRVYYKVVPIELTPRQGFKQKLLRPNDKVFAYGLEPIGCPKAESHLIFMGTGYPASQGFYTQVNSDLRAFQTVGQDLYQFGRDKILEWIGLQGKKIHVCGMSLGGSLSLLLAIDKGQLISRVDAHNPAGLHELWRNNPYDNWDSLLEKPQVIIQKQGHDPVSSFGNWKRDWCVLSIIPDKKHQGPNALLDHALNYSWSAKTIFQSVDILEDNKTRQRRNFWWYSLARGLVHYLLLQPIRYVIRPLFYLAVDYKLLLLSMLLGVGISLGLAVLIGGVGGLAVAGILGGISGGLTWVIGSQVIKLIKGFLNRRNQPESINLTIPIHTDADIYTNEQEMSFTYRELAIYYTHKHQILPDKDYSKVKSSLGGLSVNKLIEKSKTNEASESLTFKKNRAKIHLIEQSLRCHFFAKDDISKFLETHQVYMNARHRM